MLVSLHGARPCPLQTDGHARLECVYPASLAVMANLAPHLATGVSHASTERLLACLGAFARPAFLLQPRWPLGAPAAWRPRRSRRPSRCSIPEKARLRGLTVLVESVCGAGFLAQGLVHLLFLDRFIKDRFRND